MRVCAFLIRYIWSYFFAIVAAIFRFWSAAEDWRALFL